MKELSYKEEVRAEFNQYLEKIKSFGYRVFVIKDLMWNFAYLVDKHDLVSYVEYERYYGLHVSTQHQPHREIGTGFMVEKNVSLENLTRELINRSFCLVPQGFNNRYSVHVKKIIFSDMVEKNSKFYDKFIEL